MKNTLLLSTLLMCASAFASGCHHETAQARTEIQPPEDEVWLRSTQIDKAQISIDGVTKRPMADALHASGKFIFDEARVAHVVSPVSGRAISVKAQLGQHVKKGDILAIIQSPDVGGATSDLSKGEADLIAAKHDFDRKKDLFDQHACSKTELETSEDNFRKAKAERDRAAQRTVLLNAGGGLDSVSSSFALKSPIDGEIIAKNIPPNAEVQGQYTGGTAAELFTVGDIDRIWLTADIFEVDLARVKVGADVTLSVVAYPGREFHGKVDWVATTLDSSTRTAKVRCILENVDHALLPEMYATVKITAGQHDAVALPRASVVRLGDKNFVFVERGKAEDGRVRLQRVAVETTETSDRDWLAAVDPPQLIAGSPPAPTQGSSAPSSLEGTRIVTKGAILVSGM